MDRFASAALAPVDAASLIAFRVGFGLLLTAWCVDDLRTGRAQHLFEEARFHFTYFLFDFLRPWPGAGMKMHLAGLLILALSIAAGLKYRATTILFALGFSYFFLLDRTNYQNHYYLLMLISWALAILPLNRCFALDAVNGPRSETVPAWCLWLMRFHIALPYVFGGLAKVDGDWLAGEPMRTHLASKAAMPVIGPLLTSDVVVDVLTWGGLAFDLGIVPLLLWPRTRVLAYLLCIGFHLTNALLFDIHVFPWFMLVATTVFFSPAWPRRLLRLPAVQLPVTVGRTWASLPRAVSFPAVLLACYCTAQVLIPLRPFIYGDDSAWTERGHHFSWRMMLRTKTSGLRFYVVDKATGRCGVPDIYQFVREDQSQTFSRDPEMILQFAHFLAERYLQATGREAAVHALVLTSLNGRKPQLLIDPNVDLAAEPRGFVRRNWIMPLKEPLRRQPWQVPLAEWERSVELPPLTFLRPPPAHLSASPPGGIATRAP